MFLKTNLYLKVLRNYATCELKKTRLYDFHLKQGGKMVDFAGYSMPVQYSEMGIVASHIHTRTKCSIFDVSHMQQCRVYGKDRIKFMESLTVSDIKGLNENKGVLTVFTNDKGGIIDDLIVTKTDLNYLYAVTNAGCKEKDISLMKNKAEEMKSNGMDVELEFCEDLGLIAVQGPEMMTSLQPLISNVDLTKLNFMSSVIATICGVENCRITRCGYTGEDGVEISIPIHSIETIVSRLLENSSVKMAGLGARDSLRLEAGLCLYGNDIDEDTTPVEAGLTFVISKSRRKARDFPGASKIMEQLTQKNERKKRIGLISKGSPTARERSEILDNDEGRVVGVVTSGCPSPTLKLNVAMGYVENDKSFIKSGSHLKLKVRNKIIDAEVVKMPFVSAKYYYGQ